MRREPEEKRVVSFIDGQNLYFAAKDAFGISYPSYDPQKLSAAVCERQGWKLQQVRFYTGVPEPRYNKRWSDFWSQKLAQLGRQKVWTYTRPLRYGREKGIDVRIALDMVTFALDDVFDVGLIFSQDQDLSEVAKEVRRISRKESRWIKLACAYPVGEGTTNKRGINGTDWITLDGELYKSCADPRDYRQ